MRCSASAKREWCTASGTVPKAEFGTIPGLQRNIPLRFMLRCARETRHGDGCYSIVMFAALMMGPHFATSAAMNAFKLSGVPPPASMSNLARSCLPLSLVR